MVGHLQKLLKVLHPQVKDESKQVITVSNTEYCTYSTQMDIVTNTDKHTKCKTHKQLCTVRHCYKLIV